MYQFNINGNWSHNKKQNIGEYNLFNLPHYDEYDGIIFDCTNMTDQDQLELIIEKLKNLYGGVAANKIAIFFYLHNHSLYLSVKEVFKEIKNIACDKEITNETLNETIYILTE